MKPKYKYESPCIVAEVGSNHGGLLNSAISHIEEAAKAGANAVKFQMFKLEDIQKVTQQQDRKYELPPEWLPILKEVCDYNNVEFLCTPFSVEAVKALNKYVKRWKVGSFEIYHRALTDAIMATKKPVIVSCGRILGGTPWDDYPKAKFLYCISKYPAEIEDYNLDTAMMFYGISDHTRSTFLPGVAVAQGAKMIEKHFSTCRFYLTPDTPHSIDPLEFKEMMTYIRLGERIYKSRLRSPAPLGKFPNRVEIHD